MSDLISKQDLLNLPRIETRNVFGELIHESIDVLDIEKLQSVTPAEKVGHWIMHIDDLFPVESTMECDQCHKHQPITIDDNYCPSCGAKMREVKNKNG